MANPWSTEEIARARAVPPLVVLETIGAYYKRDETYLPADPHAKSFRVQVSWQGRDFRFIFTGEKWLNDLRDRGDKSRGGGGSIDLVTHITGAHFVQAVKICLNARSEEVLK